MSLRLRFAFYPLLAIAAIAWLLDPPVRVAFASGLVAFLLFYVSVFGLWRVFLLALRQPVDDASAGPNAEKQAG